MGYRVADVEQKASKTQRGYSGGGDLFGLFDLLAIDGESVGFVQVTCNRPHVHKRYQEFTEYHKAVSTWVEQWVRYDGRGRRGPTWKVFQYKHGEKFVDEYTAIRQNGLWHVDRNKTTATDF